MQLNRAQTVLRSRNPWEAMDLGIVLARRHAGLLMATWAVITVPLFLILTLIFWQYPSVAVLIIWWLKPAFERLPLYILSNALFDNTPSFKQSLKAWPALLKPQLLASLTWRRLSMTRSFDLPVQQLEGIGGAERQQRLVTLGRQYTRAPTWLTIIGLHIEMALWLGLIALLYLLIPAQLQTDWSWAKLLEITQHQWLWAEHLSNFLYVLVLIVWQPIYVACGFTLYLNRRTELEAWDIELVFRALAQRLKNSAALVVILVLCALPYSQPAFAEVQQATSNHYDELGVTEPRLLKQMLSSEQAQQSITNLLDQPPFQNYKTVTNWRFGDVNQTQRTPSAFSTPAWLDGLLTQLSFGLQALLWAVVLLLSAVIVWRYRQWLKTFGQQLLPRKKHQHAAPTTLLGLEISAASLPDDVVVTAQALWTRDPRAALSLLYRGLLHHLVEVQALPLTAAHTEGDVVALTQTSPEALQRYTQQLTLHWQNLAWGQRLLPHSEFANLCAQWQQLQQQERTV
ncbi:DUF4129 domain-containing protein [Pseudomonas sp. C27(2019)]|uniref:DUF4129 domain-containing protein n=1 Tax=Pseudomonas sp. C27(2019) TaxID=2604941 RepID=UPI001248B54F|nr:DUF4129 domain-containing protein [Pseudomonas sp. C27(2019)]QEY58456.1 DUF4129 domain-containing protein [Pseudomonas sp. C27(2019)]